MKDKAILVAILTIFLMGLPLMSVADTPSPKKTPKQTDTPSASPRLSRAGEIIFHVYNTETGEAMELEGKDYITHVVAAEMPASFSEEALKAQTVAAFTYAVYRKQNRSDGTHEGCELCTDSAHCKAYASEVYLRSLWGENYEDNYRKIAAAVDAVYGEYLTYDGEPIAAVFHSVSSGVTEAAVDVWGHHYPYLVSVDSSLDKTLKGYETAVTVSKEEFCTVMRAYSTACDFSGEPQTWVDKIERSTAGSVLTARVGKVPVTGAKLRSLFKLRSACFTVTFADDAFTFTVHGYGHGVGMSQYGANLMAKEGATYREILLHYYTDVTLEDAEKGIQNFAEK